MFRAGEFETLKRMLRDESRSNLSLKRGLWDEGQQMRVLGGRSVGGFGAWYECWAEITSDKD